MRIAREGWPFIAGAWILTVAAALLWWPLAVLLAILAIWVVSFFRDPIRPGPRGDRYVLAAAEGHVVHLTEIDEPMYVKGRALRISIFLSVFDVHVNRYPVDGTVELVHYNKGKFLHAGGEKASLDNEQASIGIRGPRGPILIRQIAGLIEHQAGDNRAMNIPRHCHRSTRRNGRQHGRGHAERRARRQKERSAGPK